MSVSSVAEGQQATDADLEIVNLPCEVCGHTQSRYFLGLRFPEYGQPGPFQLRRCAGCGVLFNSPRLVGKALERLYDRNYYVFAEPPAAAFERVVHLHQRTVARLEGMVARGRILEVGSAKGYMLGLLRDRGWAAQGVELSRHAQQFAVESMQVPTFCGTIEAFVTAGAEPPFAVAYCTDVIEHVPSPLAFVQALHRVVAPGGLLLIGTPNADADGIAEHGARWLGFNPFHVWFFSKDTLSALLDRCGFDVVEAYTSENLEAARSPAPGLVRRWLRAGMDAVGLLERLRAARSRLGRVRSASLPELRRAAGLALEQAPSFFETPDGRHERALACRGDNLVVIARRRA